MTNPHTDVVADALSQLREEVIRKVLHKRGLQANENVIRAHRNSTPSSIDSVLEEVLSAARPRPVREKDTRPNQDITGGRTKELASTELGSGGSDSLMVWRLVAILTLSALVVLGVSGERFLVDEIIVDVLGVREFLSSFFAGLLVIASWRILRLARRSQLPALLLLPLVGFPHVPADVQVLGIASAPFWVCALFLCFLRRREWAGVRKGPA
jgi:hypothetical protein